MQAKLTLTRKVVHLEVAMNNHGGTLVLREAEGSRSVDHELVVHFFERGRVPKDPDTSFIHSGGITFYIRAYLKIRSYNKGLTICSQDLNART
jgi:hypothetical protein